MNQHPTQVPTDLATLRQAHPDWFFTTAWAAAASGPDVRMFIAQRHGVTLSDFTPAGLSAKIKREEQR